MKLIQQLTSKKLKGLIQIIVVISFAITIWNCYKLISRPSIPLEREITLNFYNTKAQQDFRYETRRSIKNKYNIIKQTFEQLNIVDEKKLLKKRLIAQKRVDYGRPQLKTPQLFIYIIKRKSSGYLKSYACSIISSINTVSKVTIGSIQSLITQNATPYVILLTKKSEDKQLQQNIRLLMLAGYDVQKKQVVTDSQYKFILPFVQSCLRLVYTFGNNLINNEMARSISESTKQVRQFSLMYSQAYLKDGKKMKSMNISQTNLSSVQPTQFYKSIYIFDAKFLSIITPLNFAYYAKYTLQQMLLTPVIAIVQQSGFLQSTQKIMFEMTTQTIQFNQFPMVSNMQQKKSICFVSYPSNPFKISNDQFERYINQILKQKAHSANTTVVAHFPYNFGSSKNLMTLFKRLYQINKEQNQKIQRIRFRIKDNRAVGSLAVYESAYYFCPNKSLIVSTRHNVLFNQIFSLVVMKQVVSRYHYYHIDYQSFDSANKNFSTQSPAYLQGVRIRGTNLYSQIFRHIQIFKSDFLKTNVFYTLKCAQVDFYQTQASFAIPLIQVIHWKIGYINRQLATVLKRQYTSVEQQQIKNIQSYTGYNFLVANQLIPYTFSCLQNQVYKRYAKLKMPKIIHQIWISQSPISQIRWALRETIVKNNPQAQVILWKLQNITKQNFPIAYQLTQRTFQYHKTSYISYYALAADILRYEAIYLKGGIYIDFKMQGLKDMTNFFKYQVFFIDNDISYLRFNRPQVIGNGIMGGTQNNYFLKILLTQLILGETINFKKSLPHVTGSFVARRTLNDQQFFKILGLSFHLLLARPYEPIVSACGGENKTFDADQKVFEVVDYDTKKVIKIGLPCKQYPQSYVTNYNPLSKTWLLPKRQNMT